MILTTARLVLRPFAVSAAVPYAAIRAKPEAVATLPRGPGTAARADGDSARLVSAWAGIRPGTAPWALEDRESGRLLGHVGLRPLPELEGETESLHMLDSAAWGRGLAVEGAAAAFSPLWLRRVIALARPENAVSVAVLRKLGMRFEGALRAFGVRAVRRAADEPPPES